MKGTPRRDFETASTTNYVVLSLDIRGDGTLHVKRLFQSDQGALACVLLMCFVTKDLYERVTAAGGLISREWIMCSASNLAALDNTPGAQYIAISASGSFGRPCSVLSI